MSDLSVGEHDLLSYLKPDTFIGAFAYLVIFVLVALLLGIAASQVTINLNTTFAPAPIAITIRLSPNADLEAARQLALNLAVETVGEKALEPFLTSQAGGERQRAARVLVGPAGRIGRTEA